MSEGKTCLVGKTLTGIKISSDKEAIKFETTDGDIVAFAWGDCCSHTWIESIELPALGFPAVVTEVRELNLEKEPEEPGEYGDVIKFYGFQISTDRGEIVIDYRNESNGYYGGDLAWPGDYGHGESAHSWGEVKA